MGVCISANFDKEIPDADFAEKSDGKAITLFIDLLDTVSREKGVSPFTSFALDEEGAIDQLEGDEELQEPWFECADGLRTVSVLVKALESETKWSKEPKRLRQFGNLVNELKELERCLEIGKKKKARFYLMYY
jgi:hypothetical protein